MLIAVLVAAFLITHVFFPIIFMWSPSLQRSLIFYNVNNPYSAKFQSPEYYGIVGVDNKFLRICPNENQPNKCIDLGCWHIVPENIINETIDTDFNYGAFLENSDYPLLIYLHDRGCNRIRDVENYKVLREFFQILAVDYRSFGDSTEAELTTENIVNDTAAIYESLEKIHSGPIYFFGHCIGGAIASHAAYNLIGRNRKPAGIILAVAFTSLTDALASNKYGLWWSWLPYYNSVFSNPMKANGLEFNELLHLLFVDCPILILHAADDTIIPSIYAVKLRNYTVRARQFEPNFGEILFHLFPADLALGHDKLLTSPLVPYYISAFLTLSKQFVNDTDYSERTESPESS